MKIAIVSLLFVLLGFFASANAQFGINSMICKADDNIASNLCSARCFLAGKGAGLCNADDKCECKL
uniref:Invertebrate defensins family profile domain-containing protein n=1 Tax=Anopheles albimanus TaxID=7167 RepID=A0A182FGK9_ANOAL